jgi:hypothetical protein
MTVNSASCVSVSGRGSAPTNPLQVLPTALIQTVTTYLPTEEAWLLARVCRSFCGALRFLQPTEAGGVVIGQQALAEYRSPAPGLRPGQATAMDRIATRINAIREQLRALEEMPEAPDNEQQRAALRQELRRLELLAIPSQSCFRFSEAALGLISDYTHGPNPERPSAFTYHPRPMTLTAISTYTWNRVIGKLPNQRSSLETKALLNELCPITGKTLGESHMLVVIPPAVDGTPFTLRRLTHRAINPINGNTATKINIWWDQILADLGDVPIPPGEYLLFLGSFPGTKGKTTDQQLEVFEPFRQANPEYRVATDMEVLIPMIFTFAQSGASDIRLFFNEYVRTCTILKGCRLAVGGFGSDWPCVHYYFHGAYANDFIGLAVVRAGGSSPALGT